MYFVLIILAVNCGNKPPPGTNSAEASSTGTTYLSTVTYQCHVGHETSNSLTVTCLASGSWSSTRGPDCTGSYTFGYCLMKYESLYSNIHTVKETVVF